MFSLELDVYDDLLELVDVIFKAYPTFLISYNDCNQDQISIQVPPIPFYVIPLTEDDDITFTINNTIYVPAYVGNSIHKYLQGYMKQSWIEDSPIIVYPVFLNGEYTGYVFFNITEAVCCASNIKNQLLSKGYLKNGSYKDNFKEFENKLISQGLVEDDSYEQ
jgi:hypothetical protein